MQARNTDREGGLAMKKILGGSLAMLLLLLCASALAWTVEETAELPINETISLVDYGYGARDESGEMTDEYGHLLSPDEQEDANQKAPCMYVTLQNKAEEDQQIKLYLRFARKSSVHWSYSFTIKAGERHQVYFWYSKAKDAAFYRGNWSLDLTGKNGLVRFALE